MNANSLRYALAPIEGKILFYKSGRFRKKIGMIAGSAPNLKLYSPEFELEFG